VTEDSAGHPTAGFDDIVHQPTRLAVMVILHEARRADFGYIKQALGLTDGNLGRHLNALEESGLIKLEKGYEGRRPRTWATLTPAGRKALDRELREMEGLIKRLRK
jgi:DNA-binding MarR family transcriptional regulator